MWEASRHKHETVTNAIYTMITAIASILTPIQSQHLFTLFHSVASDVYDTHLVSCVRVCTACAINNAATQRVIIVEDDGEEEEGEGGGEGEDQENTVPMTDQPGDTTSSSTARAPLQPLPVTSSPTSPTSTGKRKLPDIAPSRSKRQRASPVGDGYHGLDLLWHVFNQAWNACSNETRQ